MRWVDDIEKALWNVGGVDCLPAIYEEVRRLRKRARRSIPHEFEACVRNTLEVHCSGSGSYTGGRDIFCMLNKGTGIWGMRQAVANVLV